MELAVNYQEIEHLNGFNTDIRSLKVVLKQTPMYKRQDAIFQRLISQLEERFNELSINRIYYGSEFCERLIPSLDNLKEAKEYSDRYKLGFTFVTPLVPDSGVEKLASIFSYLNNSFHNVEVVVNDLGVLNMLNREYPNLIPVAGRQMGKMMNDPRINKRVNALKELPLEIGTLRFMRNSAFSAPEFQFFLNNRGVSRGEFDAVYQGIDFNIPDGLTFSIHMPYSYITSGRYCFSGAIRQPDELKFGINAPCRKECQSYVVRMLKTDLQAEIYNRGKVVVNKMDESLDLNDYLNNDKISRIVISPFIPY